LPVSGSSSPNGMESYTEDLSDELLESEPDSASQSAEMAVETVRVRED
jgi:hypothetical protein